ncbi:GNAT family protein [Brevibacterium daeguense]|uniref:GNAT family protein n=1 Tax=Brevibacterium daeguense TaxID=909936 RepID=A0ABP8EGT5_9MICO|nr:GNAT family protein [Brevibacterium daeguense]
MSSFWPVTLVEGGLVLRPLQRRDAKEFAEVRRHNVDWLRPWEATIPEPDHQLPGFQQLRRILDSQARRGALLPFALEVDGRFRGQLTVSSFQWGSLLSASLGYWIDERVAGLGHTPTAVAMATDYCFSSLGLHRMEINIRPENTASLRVVEKLGFRDEGVRERFMHIDGDWRDHRTFALVAEDVPFGVFDYWRRVRYRE